MLSVGRHVELDLPPRTFKNRYAIFHCRRALEVYRLYKDQFRAYMPLERVRKDGEVREYAALPGHAFVPFTEAAAFRRAVSELYQLQQVFTPIPKHGNLGTDEYMRFLARNVMPRSIELADLVRMQRALNDEFDGAKSKGEPPKVIYQFERGDKVIICPGALLEGVEGEFSKYKGKNRARICTSIGFADIPLEFIRKI